MNWAGFSAGLAQGLNNADRIGQQIDQARLARIRTDGLAEAKAAREAEMKKAEQSVIDTQAQASQAAAAPMAEAVPGVTGPRTGTVVPDTPEVRTQAVPMPPAAGGLPQSMMPPGPPADVPVEASPAPAPAAAPPQQMAQAAPAPSAPAPAGRFQAGGQGYDTREAAVAAAQKKVPSISDFVVNTVAPKMQEWYVGQGDLENAEKLGQYMESRRGREATKSFGTAMQKLMFTNDINGGVQALGDYYNKYIDDGVDFTKGEVGADGKINITVKDRATGTERVMPMAREEIIRLGMAHDPVQLYKQGLAQVEANAKTAAEIAKERRSEAADMRKEGRAEARDIAKESRAAERDTAKAAQAHDYDIDKLVTGERIKTKNMGAAEKAKVQAKIDILKENGLSPDAVRELIPHMVGGDGYKKSTSPEEARRMLLTEHVKDPLFSSKPAAEQRRIIDQEMGVIYGANTGATPPAKPGAATPSGKQYVRDPKTGQVGVLENGKFTPLQ